ncbi:hypothetical protein M1247_03770 [Mycobacterium sp. 21AC1]|uniref:hypothetical protein n=1 Tax=[Mycobacterium] appelbergii TaxID=2939269 RepID=UPI0029391C51|nr:hypothetical protein [Mycobacterium sp. 21AC1]MDV3124019.1 hypothetical protein [Mycobacterium sp. 21AC1]
MTNPNGNPWAGLDADTGNGKLYLDESAISGVNTAWADYEKSLETLINDSLDETTGYFGTSTNPLAGMLEKAFNARGKDLTDYLKEQLSQSQAFVKTAQDAATALKNDDD